jgi:hypothetical protein
MWLEKVLMPLASLVNSTHSRWHYEKSRKNRDAIAILICHKTLSVKKLWMYRLELLIKSEFIQLKLNWTLPYHSATMMKNIYVIVGIFHTI